MTHTHHTQQKVKSSNVANLSVIEANAVCMHFMHYTYKLHNSHTIL